MAWVLKANHSGPNLQWVPRTIIASAGTKDPSGWHVEREKNGWHSSTLSFEVICIIQ